MNRIIKKRQLSADVFRFTFEAPHIARERKAGQFLIIQLDNDFAERFPLTIADADENAGTVDIIFQAVGASTMKLAAMEEGQAIANVLGPLGTPTHIEKFDAPVVCVGGGIGVAPMHPIVQAHKAVGNTVIVIMGARNSDLLVMQDEMGELADELIICTDDGSAGRKALVTEPLKELCEAEVPPAQVVAIGPPVMMKFCAATTRPYEISTLVSLNTIMVDGTGMCGGCRVTVNGETKFVCVDGPEFDGHAVDFENLMLRLQAYRPHEDDHRCRVGAGGAA